MTLGWLLWLVGSLAISEQPESGGGQVREVAVHSHDSGVVLAGTVTLPVGEGPFPGAVLLTVAGPNDRDQTLFAHKGLRVLAEGLADRGVAVLRLDDRGVGGSTGELLQATYEDLARDALAAHAILGSLPEVDSERVGFIGNSEGGAIGPLAASMSEKVAFVVLLAGPGTAGDETLRGQLEAAIQALGMGAEKADRYRALYAEFLEIQAGGTESQATRTRMRGFLEKGGRGLFPPYAFIPSDLDELTDFLLSPWHRSQVAHQPIPVLEGLEQPVLALAGDRDSVLPPALHLEAIRKALEARPSDATVKLLPRLNHLFQTAMTGSPMEYGFLAEAFAPIAIETIADWILVRFGGDDSP